MADKTMVDYTRKIKPYFEGVAPIEPVSTATAAHAVGDVFYFDGTLVKCTTAISIGDTIIVSPTTNYNVEAADDVETQIKTLSSSISGKADASSLATVATSGSFDDLKDVPPVGTGSVTNVATGTGLTGGPITTTGTISLATSGVTAGTKGATANVTGTEGTTIKVPKITVDTYGRVTALDEYTLTNKNTTYNGSSLKTSAAKTGSGTTVTSTIAASTSMDNAIGTLLNNDAALNTAISGKSAVTIGSTGTASASATRYQRVSVNGTYTTIDGTVYMEQTKTLSTSAKTTYTFTNSAITADSLIDPYTSIFGVIPSNIVTTGGTCTVTIPSYSSAVSLKVRIYIRN